MKILFLDVLDCFRIFKEWGYISKYTSTVSVLQYHLKENATAFPYGTMFLHTLHTSDTYLSHLRTSTNHADLSQYIP